MIFRAYQINEDGSFFHKLSVTFETRVDYILQAEKFIERYQARKYFLTLEIESTDSLPDEKYIKTVEGLFFASQIKTILCLCWCVRVLNCISGEWSDYRACSEHVDDVMSFVLRKVASIGRDYKFDRMVKGLGVFTVRA